MAKMKTQGRDRPWLPDDRRDDVRLKELLSDEPPTVGWLLMEAWDKAGFEFWSDMDGIADACERDAEATHDTRMAAVMKDIAKRISALPQSPLPEPGASTREELLNAAYERVAATGSEADAINTERESLRREYLRRATKSPRRMVDALNRDIATLEATDVPCAAYLRTRVAELQKVVGVDDAKSLVGNEGLTEKNPGNELTRDEPEWIESPVMAQCLSGLADRDAKQWKRTLDGTIEWARNADFCQKGKRGERPNKYQPIGLMEAILLRYHGVSVVSASIVFHQKTPLTPWREKWDAYIENNESVFEGRTRS